MVLQGTVGGEFNVLVTKWKKGVVVLMEEVEK